VPPRLYKHSKISNYSLKRSNNLIFNALIKHILTKVTIFESFCLITHNKKVKMYFSNAWIKVACPVTIFLEWKYLTIQPFILCFPTRCVVERKYTSGMRTINITFSAPKRHHFPHIHLKTNWKLKYKRNEREQISRDNLLEPHLFVLLNIWQKFFQMKTTALPYWLNQSYTLWLQHHYQQYCLWRGRKILLLDLTF